MVIPSWIFSVHFLENELSEPAQGKQLTVANNEKIPVFKRNFKFWKTFIIMSLTASHYLRTLLMGSMMILMNVIFGYWIRYNVSTFGKSAFTQ